MKGSDSRIPFTYREGMWEVRAARQGSSGSQQTLLEMSLKDQRRTKENSGGSLRDI